MYWSCWVSVRIPLLTSHVRSWAQILENLEGKWFGVNAPVTMEKTSAFQDCVTSVRDWKGTRGKATRTRPVDTNRVSLAGGETPTYCIDFRDHVKLEAKALQWKNLLRTWSGDKPNLATNYYRSQLATLACLALQYKLFNIFFLGSVYLAYTSAFSFVPIFEVDRG